MSIIMSCGGELHWTLYFILLCGFADGLNRSQKKSKVAMLPSDANYRYFTLHYIKLLIFNPHAISMSKTLIHKSFTVIKDGGMTI